MSTFRIALISVLFLGTIVIPLVTAQGLSELKIETQTYYLEDQTYVAENATLTWADITLEAGKVRFNLENRSLVASDFVRFTDSRIIAIVDRLEIDLNTQQGIFYNVTLYDATTQTFLTAKEAHKTGKLQFVAKQCSITTCDPQNPVWKIEGAQVNYHGENFSSAQGVNLLIKGIPVFYFPFLFWPTVSKRQSGFLAPSYQVISSTEEKFNLGFKFQIPYFWSIAQDQNLTMMADLIENRGVGIGIQYEYAFKNNLRGEWNFWAIRENYRRDPAQEGGRLKAADIPDSQLQPPRYKLQFNHSQSWGEQTQFFFSGQIFSDSQFQREYEQVREPNPNYFQDLKLSLSYQFELGNINFLIDRELVYEEVALLNRNLIETRVQRLPEIFFNYSDNPFQIPLTFELNGVVTRFYRVKGLIGWREIFIPRLRYRFTLLSRVHVMLSQGRRLSYYQVNNPGLPIFYADGTLVFGSQENREIFHGIDIIEAEVNTTFSRTIVSEKGVFSRVKHLITPRLLFESTADVNQAKTRALILPTLRNPDPDPVDFFDKEDALPGKQLLTLRLDNLFLVNRHLQVRAVTLPEHSIKLMKNQLSESVYNRLQALVDEKFFSESDFLLQLRTLLSNKLTAKQEELIRSFLQKGVRSRRANTVRDSDQESESWVFSRLNIIQRINLLRQDKNFVPKGPQIEDQETMPGEPLLPLQIEWQLNPGPRFSVDFFLRYSYQAKRFVESKANFNVQISANNRAQIQFHNNESVYRTPNNVFHDKTNTLSFSSIFEASNELSFGFSGKLNLSVSDKNALRRRLIEDSFFIDYHPQCYTISLVFKELAESTVTSGGVRKEIVDPSIILKISLGEVLPLPQQQFHF